MRTALGFLMVVALAGCGGSKPKQEPLANNAAPPPAPSWTIDRVFRTIDPGTGVVLYVDVDTLKASEIFAGVTEQIEKAFANQTMGPCDGLTISGKIVVSVSKTGADYEAMVWSVGGSTEPWLACLRANAESKGAKVTVDGDYLTTSTDKATMAYLVLDPEALVIAVAPVTVSRDELVARTEPRDDGAGIPEMSKLRAGGTPIWVAARGSSPLFNGMSLKFRTGSMTIDVKDHVDIDVRVALTAVDQATMLASTIQQQGQAALSMGFLTALDAHSAGEQLIVHAELTKASIDKIVSMAGAMTGSMGGGPVKPFGPP
jgi:hypothetical protein